MHGLPLRVKRVHGLPGTFQDDMSEGLRRELSDWHQVSPRYLPQASLVLVCNHGPSGSECQWSSHSRAIQSGAVRKRMMNYSGSFLKSVGPLKSALMPVHISLLLYAHAVYSFPKAVT